MIDAYEIGIQLLLQDDVSAGLAVINRGLAEVDRAIAATSANLAGLVSEADRAAKAVATAVGAKVPQPVASEPKAAVATGEVPNRPAKESSPAAITTAPVDAGGQRAGEPPTAPFKATSREEQQPRQEPLASSGAERVSTASAPAKLAGSDAEVLKRREAGPAISAGETAPVRKIEGARPSVDVPMRRSDRQASSAAAKRSGAAAPNSTLAVTATIGPSRAVLSSAPALSQVGAPMAGQSAGGPDRAAAAPWSSGHLVTPQVSSARSIERAAAPQSPGRERAESGGGAVMLDGRLVGQWLSEHMAREASRPPSGTSFFDARQTPAWNVSGAL